MTAETQGDNKGKVADVAVVISDADEEDEDDVDVDHLSSDSNDDEDSTYDDGIPGAYFGGYGRCFNCGKFGLGIFLLLLKNISCWVVKWYYNPVYSLTPGFKVPT